MHNQYVFKFTIVSEKKVQMLEVNTIESGMIDSKENQAEIYKFHLASGDRKAVINLWPCKDDTEFFVYANHTELM